MQRPFRLAISREEAKIRERFPAYMALQAAKVTTLQAPEAIVSAIIRALQRTGHGIPADRSC